VSWRGLWGQRSDVAYAHGGATVIHDGHYTDDATDGAILHAPTPAAPELISPGEEVDGEAVDEDTMPPSPPAQPDASTTPRKTRSALKKVDGRPAVYYNRPIR
jgi:hypothetical protein